MYEGSLLKVCSTMFGANQWKAFFQQFVCLIGIEWSFFPTGKGWSAGSAFRGDLRRAN